MLFPFLFFRHLMHDYDKEICIDTSVKFQLVAVLYQNLQYILLILQINIKLKCNLSRSPSQALHCSEWQEDNQTGKREVST